MLSLSHPQGDIERQKRKTATAIVTSGALTFMILAAALVTASFLMSPVIEDVFGESLSSIQGSHPTLLLSNARENIDILFFFTHINPKILLS